MAMNTKKIKRLWISIKKNRGLYLMFLPVLLYYIIFHYIPMYGIQIAFRDYVPNRGFSGSAWVGFKHFQRFFESYYFWRLLKNTLGISLYTLLVGTPLPIILAIMFHHIGGKKLKSIYQSVTYIPHFISTVVVVALISFFFGNEGIINSVFNKIGLESYPFKAAPEAFWHLFVWSGTWQTLGWSSIIYSASIAAIPEDQFEAAHMEGAGIIRSIWHIILPGILPTITILTILSMGRIMSVGFEKILLMQNNINLENSDVISTYIYQIGILRGQHSFSTAIGLFNNIVNFILLIIANVVSKSVSDTSLW